MKAANWYEKGVLKVEDIPLPELGVGEVRLKIMACGICGSDIHEYRDGPFLIPKKQHPITGNVGGPVVLGHEFSATVDDVGEDVTQFDRGDRVTVNPLIYCGECAYCKNGQLNMCTQLGTLGFAANGAFAEYAVVSEDMLLALPTSISADMGAFIEPLAVAVRAVKRAGVKLGQSVVIVGAGPIGLLVLQVCRAFGAEKIFVVEPIPSRRELALQLGACHIIDPVNGDPGKIVAEMTNNLRADVAIDCAGIQQSFETAVRTTGRRATICVVGLALEPIKVSFLQLWAHEKSITFSSGYENEFQAAITLLANGQVDIEKLITARIELKNIVAKGFDPLIKRAEQHIKILVYPNGIPSKTRGFANEP
jgi:(R,R)-butanediol dehydrogenase/meso-butanediol dehydrogenase/diacetyl reductase